MIKETLASKGCPLGVPHAKLAGHLGVSVPCLLCNVKAVLYL